LGKEGENSECKIDNYRVQALLADSYLIEIVTDLGLKTIKMVVEFIFG
jgi:hypothetical protein